jgi:hypothetical protein
MKIIERKACVLIFSTTIVWNISPSKTQMNKRFHVKCPIFFSDFNETNFLHRFSKNTRVSNLMKILPVKAELLNADRANLTVAFGNYAN